MSRRIQIGLLEDDPVIGEMLMLSFDEAGWACGCYRSVAQMVHAINTTTFDLLVLDWVLPDGTAKIVIDQVRDRPGLDLPILIVSLRDEETLIVQALQLGADDFVVKPLRLAEVNARIETLLRRRRGELREQLVCGDFRLDARQGLLLRAGRPQHLTRTEFELIRYLFQHSGELLTRERLLKQVWGTNPDLHTRTVDIHVGRLRKKLGLTPGGRVEIVTIYGHGYRLVAQSNDQTA